MDVEITFRMETERADSRPTRARSRQRSSSWAGAPWKRTTSPNVRRFSKRSLVHE